MIKNILFFLILLIPFSIFISTAKANETTYIHNGTITTDDARQTDDDFKKIEAYNTWFNHYTDYANGYSMNYPVSMTTDVSLSPVRTVFSDDQTTIEVYYDIFNNTL